ncbi:MAG: acyl-CoA thioesterase [Candidatus Marinimicrobia bacterium]|nr:acyl-CoA thioesterase [Candidatus Neomarinimicrobiota bacterium]
MIENQYLTRIYYRDIDQMGVVYYNRYFEYFEAARTELLRSIGLEVTLIEQRGYYLPVVSAHCDYHRSAQFDDEITIISRIDSFMGARLRIDYQATLISDDRLLASGYTEHCFTNKDGKPTRPPGFFRSRIREHLNG